MRTQTNFDSINFQTEGEEADDAEGVKKNVSPFAKTTILFTRPAQNLASGSVELPAGHIVEFLVGFENKVLPITTNSKYK